MRFFCAARAQRTKAFVQSVRVATTARANLGVAESGAVDFSAHFASTVIDIFCQPAVHVRGAISSQRWAAKTGRTPSALAPLISSPSIFSTCGTSGKIGPLSLLKTAPPLAWGRRGHGLIYCAVGAARKLTSDCNALIRHEKFLEASFWKRI